MLDITTFARNVGLPYGTVWNHMNQGYCKWPRKIHDGITKNIAYGCWENMIQRSTNPNATGYENYGGRGISVFPLWKISFKEFINHIGPRPSKKHSIDRINNDGNYEPGNVRWATNTEQSANKRKDKINKPRKHYKSPDSGSIKLDTDVVA